MLAYYRRSFTVAFLLLTNLAYSQNESYVGGSADGQAKAGIETAFSFPTAFQPFRGDIGDGHESFSLESAFGLPVAFQPFRGSTEDGYDSDSLIVFNPRGYITMYYPYAGDSSDGWTNYPIIGVFITLPLQLLEFYGEQENDMNILRWITTNEEQTDSFVIQRSADALRFTDIGAVKAAGNHSGNLSYRYDDTRPLAANNYYRLKMLDQDGRFTFSSIILLRRYESGIKLTLFPNPTTQTVNIMLNQASSNNEVRVRLIDTKGAVLQQKMIRNSNLITLNLDNHSPGMYFIRVDIDGEQSTWKIIKQ